MKARFSIVLLCTFLLETTDSRKTVIPDFSDAFDPGGCTTAVIAGFATESGRPLLWKNRDRSIEDQEVVYFNDGELDYITITNAADSTQAWGGVNRAGFAIEDANNWNVEDTISGPEDDGLIIKRALKTCHTVNDFQALLDSTTETGHTVPAIFGVIDAAGGAAMFETFMYSYIRYDATDSTDAPLGILVRSNFSYAGSSSGRIGVYRHNRAKSLIESAATADSLSAKFLTQTVMRDLRTTNNFNPYPLPFEGQQGNLPQGWISTEGAICRRLTAAGIVVEGILPGEDPLLTTAWIFPMAVQYGVALPFWVASGATPELVNGDSTASLCDAGLRLKNFGQHAPGFVDTLDTYILEDGLGGGLHLTTIPLENYVFTRTDSMLAMWREQTDIDSAAMLQLSAELADSVYQRLAFWPQAGETMLPPAAPEHLTINYEPQTGIVLRWNAVHRNSHDLPISITGYSVWQYENCLHAPNEEEFVGRTADTVMVIAEPADLDRAFFVVRAEW